jgi:hypothetical protein
VSLRDDVRAAHAALCSDPPPLPGWPHAGRAAPNTSLVPDLRRLGWPVVTAEATVANPDPRRPAAVQPVTCVPAAWLRRLAELLGWPWGRACRYEIPDDAT